jgi:hypothetical protein
MSGFIASPVDTIIRYEVGDTPQTVFVVPFPFDDLADLLVTVDGEAVIVSLTATTEVEGFYTAASVVLPAPAVNAVVFIQRRTQLEQQVKYAAAGAFRTQPLNAEVSRMWMAMQDLRRELDYSLGVVLGEDTTFTPNALVNTITNVILAKIFPPGMVAQWAGFEDQLPEGWSLFEVMRDKFVVASGPTRPQNTTGGADVRTTAPDGGRAATVTGGRVLTPGQMPRHTHPATLPLITNFGSGGGATRVTDTVTGATAEAGNDEPHDHPLDAIPDHDHDVTVVPAYYAICWIIRTGLVVAVPPDLGDVITLPSAGLFRSIPFACSDEITPIAVATNLTEVPATTSLTATKVKVSLRTASSSGDVQVNVRVNGVAMTASPIVIPAGVKVVNATILAVTNVVEDQPCTVDVVAAGTGARGLKVAIIGTVPT